jgi:hypothetical protein
MSERASNVAAPFPLSVPHSDQPVAIAPVILELDSVLEMLRVAICSVLSPAADHVNRNPRQLLMRMALA